MMYDNYILNKTPKNQEAKQIILPLILKNEIIVHVVQIIAHFLVFISIAFNVYNNVTLC